MSGPRPLAIILTVPQHAHLERLIRRPTTPQGLVRRAQILLQAAQGANNAQIARHLGMHVETVRVWRARWVAAADRLEAAEAEVSAPTEVAAIVEEVLRDAPRPGAPPTFTAEQVVAIVALACEAPEDSERPPSHWNARELADEAQKRRIVETISPRSVGRFLKGGGRAAPSQSLLAPSEAGRSRRV